MRYAFFRTIVLPLLLGLTFMNIPIEARIASSPTPPSVNLYRHDGKPRTRFSAAERMAHLGGHEQELEVYFRLFARRRCPYILQRQRNGQRQPWRTVNHALPDDLIVRHLSADRLPGVEPIWVGARGWDYTKFVAIDVDCHGDQEDFVRRCEKVERALYVLGIPRTSWLVQPTPSGGRHYYFFTYRSIPAWGIPITLELVGLFHVNGQIEIYPSETQGLRLPFGCVPGQAHDPEAWVRFIRDYESGTFPRVSWDRCTQRAERYAQRQAERELEAYVRLRPRNSDSVVLDCKQPSPPVPMGVPKAQRDESNQGEHVPRRSAIRPKDIDDLWQRGIEAEGSRLDATKKIAWNFIFVRGMSAEEAADEITQWVYRTGKNTSRDVRADIKHGTRKVAEQTRKIVAWYAARRREGGVSGSRRFSIAEIDAVVAIAAALPAPLRSTRIRFAIDFLNFAKREGAQRDDGWTCCPSVHGIIRKWKGCSGTRYKAHLDWAVATGLIEMIREKWQSKTGKGRARTYVIHVPASSLQDRTLSYAEAIEYVDQRVCTNGEDTEAAHCEGNVE
jgi:hypothetical protein